MRRKGQSLEFHEYAPYVCGDDIRHVDWRASARHGDENDWLVRRFTAVEQSTLMISIDARATMRLPESLPKLGVAIWLAEALGAIALRRGDRVVTHRLFGKDKHGLAEFRGAGSRSSLRARLRRMADPIDDETPFNACSLERFLPPASAWVLITDLYFPLTGGARPQDTETSDAIRRLIRTMASAQEGLRWLVVVDLDAWPYEKRALGEGPRRLEGPGAPAADRLYQISADTTAAVAERIRSHKRRFRKLASRAACDFSNWAWPEDPAIDAAAFFKSHFFGDSMLQRLFMREA